SAYVFCPRASCTDFSTTCSNVSVGAMPTTVRVSRLLDKFGTMISPSLPNGRRIRQYSSLLVTSGRTTSSHGLVSIGSIYAPKLRAIGMKRAASRISVKTVNKIQGDPMIFKYAQAQRFNAIIEIRYIPRLLPRVRFHRTFTGSPIPDNLHSVLRPRQFARRYQ